MVSTAKHYALVALAVFGGILAFAVVIGICWEVTVTVTRVNALWQWAAQVQQAAQQQQQALAAQQPKPQQPAPEKPERK